jgi:mannose/fructose/N-acetylgalactosamine-specific phosphotransferase system component IID/mannose/fructose/N-acetylgalactosamine-specific phosphotransferase system component IIC
MSRKSVAAGLLAALAMLAVAASIPASVFAAGAVIPAEHVKVAAGQAALIALGYYLSNSPWLFGLAYYTLFRPLVAGLLVGIILGHPAEGTLIGAAINVPYLGFISAGGNLPGDPGLAGWVGTTIALAGHLDPASAIGIAVPLGLLGTVIFFGRMAVSPIFAHWADARAEKADIGGVALMNWLPSQVFLFVISWVPVFLLALNGGTYVSDALAQLPLWVTNGLIIAGGILPAIGIALTMRFIFRGSAIPYFFIGFILYTFTGGSMSLVVIAALGLALAYLHLSFTQSGAPAAADSPRALQAAPAAEDSTGSTVSTAAGPGVHVTRRDLLKSWALWSFFSHANYNYERLQGTGFAHSMTPIIRRLYKTEDEIRAALKRHLVFFNTEPNFGNVIHGAVIAMEEQRANGAAIDDDAINSVKAGLMGPISGIGDSMSQSTITPILLALGIGIAGGTAGGRDVPAISAGATGNPLGPIIYVTLISIVIVAIGYTAWMQGYLRGRTFVTELLRSGTIDRVLVGAGVLGNLVLGALAASFVTIHLAPTVTIARAQLNIQASVLDPVFPGLLPLGLVLLTWWLLRRRVSPLALLAAYLVFSILAAYPFFGPGQANANDYSYEACTSSLLHPFAPCGTPPPSLAPAPAPSAAPTVAPAPSPAPAASPTP